jgi:putative flippase GtrA
MIKKVLAYQERITGDSLSKTLKRYLIFVTGGLIGWFLVIGPHLYLHNKFGINPVFSYAVGILIADIFTFIYHRLITFKITTEWRKRFTQFSVLIVFVGIANWALFTLSRSVLDLPFPDVLISFVITGILSVINFIINRLFIFRHH